MKYIIKYELNIKLFNKYLNGSFITKDVKFLKKIQELFRENSSSNKNRKKYQAKYAKKRQISFDIDRKIFNEIWF